MSWGTVGAIIQICMGNQYYKGSDNNDLARDAALMTLSSQFKMLDQLFRDSTPSSPPGELEWVFQQIQTMLFMNVKPACCGRECSCLGAHSVYVEELVTFLPAMIPRVANS
jgi:hypothetical protein